MGEVVVGISGASGAIYGKRLTEVLADIGKTVRLVVTDSGRLTLKHECDTTPEELPLGRPVALVFGSEGPGITEAARAEADHFVRIPMYGFTESFNISVAAALTLQTVTRRVRASSDIDWRVPESEYARILGDWASRTVKDAQGLLQRLRSGEAPPPPHAPSA